MRARLAPAQDLLLAGMLILAVFALAASADFYGLRLLTISGAYALMVIGYQFIFGLAGSLSLAQGTFFGLGAYVAGILGTRYGWDFAAAMPLAAVVPAALALIVAIPVLRLESHYFALATLGIGQVVLLVAVNWESFTGGANGIPGVPAVALLGMEVPPGLAMLAFVWILVAIATALFFWTSRGLRGLGFLMLREEPLAAASIGLDGGLLRLFALFASAALAGVGGAVYVHTSRVISPEALEFPVMVTCLSMAVIGGRSTASGAIAGAVLLVHLPEWFRFLEGWYLAAYGAGLLAAIVVMPEGMAGALARILPRATAQSPEASPAPQRPARDSGGTPVVAVDHVVKSFGGLVAVDDVSLAVRPGEILGLIGPNGSGKTTLANIISGFEIANSGAVMSGDTEISRLPPHRRARLGIARTFQAGHLVPELSVLESVACAAGSRDCSQAEGQALSMLTRLGIESHANEACGGLPQGTRRLVEVARALALRPSAIVLDEPAAGLAGPDLALLSERLREIAASGTGLLLIEHNMSFLLPLADRIACLDEGRLIALGDVESVRSHPDVLRVYLGTRRPPATPAP